MSKEADDLLNSIAEWKFAQLTKNADLEFWVFKCRADACKLIGGGV